MDVEKPKLGQPLQRPRLRRGRTGQFSQRLLRSVFTARGPGSRHQRPSNAAVAELLEDVILPGASPAQDMGASEEEEGLAERSTDPNYTVFIEEGEHPGFPVISFLSPFAIFLDRLRILFSLWSVIYTPLVAAFDTKFDPLIRHPMAKGIETCGDLIFVVGTVLALVTTVGSTADGREYVARRYIIRRRLTSLPVWLDGASCLPLFIDFVPGQWIQLLRLLRLHWILSVPPSHFECRYKSPVQVVQMLVWIIMSMHLAACLWYALVSDAGTLELHFAGMTIISQTSHYLVAFRAAVYMVTGRPVASFSDDELVLIGVVSPLGGIFFAFIYGNTTMLLTRLNIPISRHHEHMVMVQRTMRTLGLPSDLRQRITKYHHFMAVHHNINAYSLLMQGLSVNLFIELKAQLFKKMFSEGPFFTGCPGGFLRKLLQVMVEVTFCPGDVVIRCGDVGDCMYFVVKGRLDVLNSRNAIIGKLSENQYFGEVALLISTPRLVSIRASTYCLLGMIRRDSFMPILDAYPEQRERMFSGLNSYKIPEGDAGTEAGEEAAGLEDQVGQKRQSQGEVLSAVHSVHDTDQEATKATPRRRAQSLSARASSSVAAHVPEEVTTSPPDGPETLQGRGSALPGAGPLGVHHKHRPSRPVGKVTPRLSTARRSVHFQSASRISHISAASEMWCPNEAGSDSESADDKANAGDSARRQSRRRPRVNAWQQMTNARGGRCALAATPQTLGNMAFVGVPAPGRVLGTGLMPSGGRAVPPEGNIGAIAAATNAATASTAADVLEYLDESLRMHITQSFQELVRELRELRECVEELRQNGVGSKGA